MADSIIVNNKLLNNTMDILKLGFLKICKLEITFLSLLLHYNLVEAGGISRAKNKQLLIWFYMFKFLLYFFCSCMLNIIKSYLSYTRELLLIPPFFYRMHNILYKSGIMHNMQLS